MWFIHYKVLLAKDNLVKRNWCGNAEMVFLRQRGNNITLVHLVPFAHIIWHIVQMTFNIFHTTNITKLFWSWLNGIAKKD